MNKRKLILRLAGTVFGIVTILHFLRITTGIPVWLGDFFLPVWVNWVGMIATGLLGFWLWRFSFEL